MKVAIVGGSLQGTEATYLAGKAGWETILIDRHERVPARNLADRFVRADVTAKNEITPLLEDADFVLPALENDSALHSLAELTAELGKPFAFDPKAYEISASKPASNRFLRDHAVPIPRSWPDCDFPLVCKPATGSGSEGVSILATPADLERCFPHGFAPDHWILQEYLVGPTFSIEVIGHQGHWLALPITDLHMDSHHDCKRVTAPSRLTSKLQAEFRQIALGLGQALSLEGIMDVEVVLHDGRLLVLEIDARLPSQTPTAVYWSNGINMVEILGVIATRNGPISEMPSTRPVAVIYEHIRVAENTLTIAGEHLLTEAALLQIKTDFFGADEAITDYHPGSSCWTATLICTGASKTRAKERRQSVLEAIRAKFKLTTCRDESSSGQNRAAPHDPFEN